MSTALVTVVNPKQIASFGVFLLSGLVRAYLAIPKHKEALCAAREAMKAMPQSAKALTLVGDVYAQNPDGREKVLQ
jgi:hypothetical protein